MHWSQLTRNGISMNPTTTTVALQANMQRNQKSRSPILCTNKNCGHRGHLVENYYWLGGGKEGQFPPGFGKHGGDTGTSRNTSGTSTTGSTTANVAMVSANVTSVDH